MQKLNSFNSLLIQKFTASAQGTSCPNFFPAHCTCVNFFGDDGLVQEFVSYAYALAGYFFQNHPPPLKLNGWPLIRTLCSPGKNNSHHRLISSTYLPPLLKCSRTFHYTRFSSILNDYNMRGNAIRKLLHVVCFISLASQLPRTEHQQVHNKLSHVRQRLRTFSLKCKQK